MAFLKSFPGGKKQAPMPKPNSAAYKKIVAAKNAAAGAKAAGGSDKSSSGKNNKKHSKPSSAFSSLKSRQMLIERVKRAIWASVMDINEAIIKLALAGNFHAAKALFDFAGVYSLPTVDDGDANTAPIPVAAEPATSNVVQDPVDAFFRSIGVAPTHAEPEPDMVGA